MSTFMLLILGALIRHQYLAHMLFITHRVDGFCFHHPSSAFGARNTMSNHAKRQLVKAGISSEEIVSHATSSTTNSSRNEDDGEILIKESDVKTTMSYPWSKVQEWALRDNLPKYTVRIQTKVQDSGQSEMTLSSYALWRNLQEDVPELCGYPIDFLRSRQEKMHKDQQTKPMNTKVCGDNATESKVLQSSTTTVLGILPFLQDYEFSAEGGICGYVYGLNGLSDGSRIQTSEVQNVKETLPRGYIQTSDGSSFELGRPLETGSESLSKRRISNTVTNFGIDNLSESAKNIDLRRAADVVEDADGMLLRLGATTGILLAGATAFNMFSHHLTVNVFWV
mmetsp:Transcript_23238/g.54821  ORF Transcript_23238/g.54821 Transcript_23238/m.54821 type:complete len:338 (+) Transcript_23238:125-1138(+)